jgi:23S rRNA (adenine2503-C2)-methyltransferase
MAITDLSDAELESFVVELDGKPFQARQLVHWIYKQGATTLDECKNIPARLRDALAAKGPLLGSRVVHNDVSTDGTEKLLIELVGAEGESPETIETVLIPEGKRNTLCISTQVGCPVACIFCASGLNGVRRNLTSGEIIEQVLHARRHNEAGRNLTNLVVMGIGEPMLNLDNLLLALDRLHDPSGLNFGARRITVSTSGYPDRIDRFAEAPHAFNLAISLHTADDALRKRLVPTATASVKEIVDAAKRYAGRTGRQVTFEVVLLAEVNDRPRDAAVMIQKLRLVPCTVNLLPWNPVSQIPDLKRPGPHRVSAFAGLLREGGLNVTVRRQRGADRSAACGQLRIAVSQS